MAGLSACGGGLIDEGVDIKAVFVTDTIGFAVFRTAREGVLVLAGDGEGNLSSFARSDLKDGLSLVRVLQDEIHGHVFGCCRDVATGRRGMIETAVCVVHAAGGAGAGRKADSCGGRQKEGQDMGAGGLHCTSSSHQKICRSF